MFESFVDCVRDIYRTDDYIPLHEPRFIGREEEYVLETIRSTFVSSVGSFVDRFERIVEDYIGCGHAVATVNGTAALHMSLLLAGVGRGEEVITQSLTFAPPAMPYTIVVRNRSLSMWTGPLSGCPP